MGFNGALVTTTYANENRPWLKPVIGDSRAFKSITLDLALFTAGTHFPNGYLPSGLTLGLKTATGLYGPYDNAAVDGRTVMTGFLFNTEWCAGATTGSITTSMVRVGVIIAAMLPANHGLDANGKLDLTQMIYE